MVKLLLVNYCIGGESSLESYFHVGVDDVVVAGVDDGGDDDVDGVDFGAVIVDANGLGLERIAGKKFEVVVAAAKNSVAAIVLFDYKGISASFVLMDSIEVVGML